MKLTITEMCTLNRALGIIEGASDYLNQSTETMLFTAVEMIDEMLSKAKVETRMDGDNND